MKLDDLKKAIRILVREEVKRIVYDEVKQAVTEEVNKAMSKILVEMVREIKSNDKSQTIVESTPAPTVINTKNPRLNSVLAETAMYSKSLPKSNLTSNLAELMDGEFNKIGQTENVSYKEQQSSTSQPTYERPSKNMDFLKQMVGESVVPQQKSVLDSGAEIPDVLRGVFKKDFRTIMKKMDEVKKNSGGGFIDPSRILG